MRRWQFAPSGNEIGPPPWVSTRLSEGCRCQIWGAAELIARTTAVFWEECPKSGCACPDVGSALVARVRSVLTWPAAPAYGCRSRSNRTAGVAGSRTPPSAPRSWRDRRPPDRSKFPMRAALNHSIPRAVDPPRQPRRPGVAGRPRGQVRRMERTCLPHTNTIRRLISFDESEMVSVPPPKQDDGPQWRRLQRDV